MTISAGNASAKDLVLMHLQTKDQYRNQLAYKIGCHPNHLHLVLKELMYEGLIVRGPYEQRRGYLYSLNAVTNNEFHFTLRGEKINAAGFFEYLVPDLERVFSGETIQPVERSRIVLGLTLAYLTSRPGADAVNAKAVLHHCRKSLAGLVANIDSLLVTRQVWNGQDIWGDEEIPKLEEIVTLVQTNWKGWV